MTCWNVSDPLNESSDTEFVGVLLPDTIVKLANQFDTAPRAWDIAPPNDQKYIHTYNWIVIEIKVFTSPVELRKTTGWLLLMKNPYTFSSYYEFIYIFIYKFYWLFQGN